jgi:hypothetical protein
MIEQREWRWVLIVSAIALLISSIPYLLGWTLQSEERRFGGFVYAVEDGYSYLADMREGADGAWLFTIPYTSEPHPPSLFFLFHLLLGKVATLLPGDDLPAKMVWTYHAARILFGLGLLATVYRFLAAFTSSLGVRRLAFLLTTFGGGLGWLLIALGQPGWLGSIPLDLILPEGFTFLVIYALPHIALARTLLLWGVLYMLRSWENGGSTRGAFLCGLLWLAMGLIVPFYVTVAWAVMGAMGIALTLRIRRLPWRQAGLGIVMVALSTPPVLYSAWVFTSDPVYAGWAAQNLILSPHPFHYLAAFGVPLLLAAWAMPAVWREESRGWAAVAWVVVVPFLVYFPFNLQRRLVEGVQVPLSLLAAHTLHRKDFLEKLRISRQTAAVVLLAILVPTNVTLVAGNCLTLQQRPVAVFRDSGEIMAMNWLDTHVETDDVVLSAYETGNYLPARVSARVFVGHGPETVRLDEKRALMGRFFDPTTADTWRQELLEEYGIDWVFWGPYERAQGSFDPQTAPYLETAYEHDEYAVFHVAQ